MREHGTYAKYTIERCRCEPCRAKKAEYERRRARRKAMFAFHPEADPMVDPNPARQHIHALMAFGMGYKTVAKRAGLSQSAAYAIMLGSRKRILRTTETRILAVRLDHADGQRIDATGTRRRLQALAAFGWSLNHVSRVTGYTRSAISRLADNPSFVLASTARTIAALYDELSMTPGPSVRAARDAVRRGFVPPLAWDDDNIDDPTAQPHGDIERPLSAVERCIEDYHDTWAHHGGDIQQAADRLGMTRDHLDKTLSRARQQGIEIRRPLGMTA